MLPSEQSAFCELVMKTLAAYGKQASESDLETWWEECRGLGLDALQSAMRAHREDPDRGERAPRPVDIVRRMKAGKRSAQQCACVGVGGQCQYPGIFSDGTTGEGPWYCPWHREERSGPEAQRWIDVSQQVPYEEAKAKRQARMLEEAQRAPGVVDTSHLIAKRHGNRAWRKSEPVEYVQNPDAEAA